ncbi:MAG: methionyl-tRNA formyltransferase [Alphaproteobacteria bacterium]|nr:methionyl-tRNA formyltransferase [Alphaproteobacteria bacterium]
MRATLFSNSAGAAALLVGGVKMRARKETPSVEELRECDVAVVFACGAIFSKEMLTAPRLGCVNLHPSLLPRWRGASPVQAAIIAGDKISGFSWIQMVERVDAGPVLARGEVAVGDDETAPQLETRLVKMAAEALPSLLADMEAGRANGDEQDDSLATYAPRLKREDGRLDWSLPADELARRVRGFQPWPGTYSELPGGERLKVLAARVAEASAESHTPGERLQKRGGVVVACGADGRGALALERVQRSGRAAMNINDFLRGFQFPPRLS